MRVFFVQGQPGCSAKAQYAAILEKTGLAPGSPATKFYEPGPKNAENLAAAVIAGRGQPVEIAWGLRPLGNDRQEIVSALARTKERLRETPLIIRDAVSGQRSDRDGPEMMDAVLSKIHGELREPPEGFDAIGQRGAERRWKKQRLQRKPEAVVRVAWFDKEAFKTDPAVAAWAGLGWSKSTLFKTFGPSGRDRGRRPSKTGAALAPSKAPAVAKKRAKRKASIKRKRK